MTNAVDEYPCVGGPMDGQLLIRRPTRGIKGVLLVDRPAEKVWVYEWDPDTMEFQVRDAKGDKLVESGGPQTMTRAAVQYNYDVVAAPWVGGGA